SLGYPEQIVRRRQDDPPEPLWILGRQRLEERSNRPRDLRRGVPRERRVHPALREEDVAGALDLAEHLEARLHVLGRARCAERMMEVADPLEDPRFAPAVHRIREARE